MNNISKENTILNSKVKLNCFSKSLLSVKVQTHLDSLYFFLMDIRYLAIFSNLAKYISYYGN